jgi:PPOX class probable F420-dependent enzyme
MREMTHEEYREFMLEGTRTAKLATVRFDGRPHVAPVWFVMDGEDVILTTGKDTVKGKNILRDGRVALCVDDEEPPFHFVAVEGEAEATIEDPDMLRWATRIGGRYMGEENAEAFGRRNAVPDELLVRVKVMKIVTAMNMTD